MRDSKELNEREVRKYLLVVRYRKLDGEPWRRIGRLPQIERYLCDVSEKYRHPLIEFVTPVRVVIRVFDEEAVDLARLIDRLGDYSRAVARCDECLGNEVAGDDEVDFMSCTERWN